MHTGLTGAMAGAAAAGVGALVYASSCPDDSPLFVATWYPLATLICMGAGALAGRWFARLVNRERYFFTSGSRIALNWSMVSFPP